MNDAKVVCVLLELLNNLPDNEIDVNDISWSMSWDTLSCGAQERVKIARWNGVKLLERLK